MTRNSFRSSPHSSSKSVPPIDPGDLRDQADPDRVERIWNRLEPELHCADRVIETKTPSRHVWLIAAALAGTFGVGVWIGHVRDGRDAADAKSALPALPVPEKASKLLATTSASQTFPLANGGKVLLQPDSTVEVGEPSDTGMTLRLFHGSASIDATHAVGGPISIIAGEARLTAPAGGSVAVTRHERDMDVVVSGGSVDIESPNGHQVLALGQSARAVPTVATIASQNDIVPRPRPEVVRPRTPDPQKDARNDMPEPRPTSQPLETPPVSPPIASSWTTKVDIGKYDEALSVLGGPSGLELAIRSTQNPHELLLLGDLARSKNRTDLWATAAQRLVDGFPGDQNSTLIAFELSNYFRDAKNTAAAEKYNQLAQHGRLAEEAVCSQLTHNETSPTLVEAAKGYESTYPHGYCKDVADQILAEAKADEPKKDDAKDAGKKEDAKDPAKKDDAKDAPKDGAKPEDSAHPAPSSSATPKAGPPSPPKQPAPKAAPSAKD